MDWLDYREKLGIGFSDEEKGKLFIGKVQNFIYYDIIAKTKVKGRKH